MSTYQSQTARIVLGTQGVTYLDSKGKRVSFTGGSATLNVTKNHKGERKSVTLIPAGERKAVATVDLDRVLGLISPTREARAAFLSHKG